MTFRWRADIGTKLFADLDIMKTGQNKLTMCLLPLNYFFLKTRMKVSLSSTGIERKKERKNIFQAEL